jgi:uncharacterized protein (TIGR00369 family)
VSDGALLRDLGAVVEAAGDGRARLGIARADVQLRGVRDSINGGVVAALAEAAFRVCLEAALVPGERIVRTQEVSVVYLSAARGERTTFEARLLRKGRRLAAGAVDVRDVASGALNATALVSCALEPPPTT